FLGFTLHRGAVRDRANGDAIILRALVGDGESLGLRQSGAERTIAQKDPLRVQMRFAMTGKLAADAAKTFQVLKRHAVEPVIGAQGVDSVFGMTGIIDE